MGYNVEQLVLEVAEHGASALITVRHHRMVRASHSYRSAGPGQRL